MTPRVCIVTAGHLSTCPRMLKAADALAADHDVRVVSVRHTPWADEADAALARAGRWRWTAIDYRREHAPAVYAWTGLRQRLARQIASPGRDVAAPIAARAYGRVHTELVRAILAEPADLIYGGTTGALAAVAEAAAEQGIPYGLDLEDFHAAEHAEPGGALDNRLAHGILSRVTASATVLTTSSSAMADAYDAAYRLRPSVIHNTFPLPQHAPALAAHAGAVRCYWFSQTIGPGRGLEDFVHAAGEARFAGVLTLRGRPIDQYVTGLRALASEVAPQLRIDVCPPGRPDAMIDLCREHHLGLGLEPGGVANNALALSNKVLTYPLAGLALLMTDTPGQRELANDVGEAAMTAPPGDIASLAGALERWTSSPDALYGARRSAWEAARRRWHWEHPSERGALRSAIGSALGVRA